MSYLLSALGADEVDAALAAAHHSLRPGGLLVVHDFMLDDDGPGPTTTRAVVPAVPGLAAGRVVVHRRRAGRPVGRRRASCPTPAAEVVAETTKVVLARKGGAA